MDTGPTTVPYTLPPEVPRLMPFVLCFSNPFFLNYLLLGLEIDITMHVWKSEDSCQESRLFSTMRALGWGSDHQVTSAFTCSAILTPGLF